jgi:hypothetical protein
MANNYPISISGWLGQRWSIIVSGAQPTLYYRITIIYTTNHRLTSPLRFLSNKM